MSQFHALFFSRDVRKHFQSPDGFTEFKKSLAKGKSVQEALNISEKAMIVLRQAAKELLDTKRYQEACDAYLFLSMIDSDSGDDWLHLGMAFQFCHQYEHALDAYEMAAHFQIDDPTPYFYLAKCLFALHDHENALYALDLAIEYADDRIMYAELAEQAKAARITLLKTMKGGF